MLVLGTCRWLSRFIEVAVGRSVGDLSQQGMQQAQVVIHLHATQYGWAWGGERGRVESTHVSCAILYGYNHGEVHQILVPVIQQGGKKTIDPRCLGQTMHPAGEGERGKAMDLEKTSKSQALTKVVGLHWSTISNTAS